MNKLNALILLGVVGFSFAEKNDTDTKRRLKEGFYMRLSSHVEHCDLQDGVAEFVFNLYERNVLKGLEPADIQELLMRKNAQGKTLSDVARSKSKSKDCRIFADRLNDMHREADLKEYDRDHVTK